VAEGHHEDVPQARGDDWSGQTRTPHKHLEKTWFELVASASTHDDSPPRTRELPLRKARDKDRRPSTDLPLFAWTEAHPDAAVDTAAGEDALDRIVTFPGLRL
jgi:hypothetical protein